MSNSIAAASSGGAAVSARLRAELSAGALALPVLPDVAVQVLASAGEDQLDAGHLADLIQQDAELSRHVLRVVNSPAFRGAAEIVALKQAIARLGTVRIREIALSASLRHALFEVGRYQRRADAAWQVALSAGLWSREVARLKLDASGVAYTCGLLVDIGIPLLLRRLGECAPDLDDAGIEAVLADLAAPAGELLGRAWGLPAAVLSAVVNRADPMAAGEHAKLACVAACGAALGRWMCDRSLLAADVVRLPAASYLQLSREELDFLLEKQSAISISMESMVF